MNHYIQYATKDNRAVHISEVESGLECGCFCPHCNAKLVAKKGSIVVHHFAHYHQNECDFAYESSLHLGVKRVLENERRFLFPPIMGRSLFEKDVVLKDSILLSLDSVCTEIRVDAIIPDILIRVGNAECILEIFVTHCVDEVKQQKIEKMNVAAIEIDFSKEDRDIDDLKIKSILLSNNNLKHWIFNPKQRVLQDDLHSKERLMLDAGIVDAFKNTHMKAYFYGIYGCPILPKWKKTWNVSLYNDCMNCAHYISNSDGEIVYCNARYCLWEKMNRAKCQDGISKSMPEFENTRSYLEKLNICPECGNMLIVRNGKKGPFLGCKGFPECRYSKSINQETGELS